MCGQTTHDLVWVARNHQIATLWNLIGREGAAEHERRDSSRSGQAVRHRQGQGRLFRFTFKGYTGRSSGDHPINQRSCDPRAWATHAKRPQPQSRPATLATITSISPPS